MKNNSSIENIKSIGAGIASVFTLFLFWHLLTDGTQLGKLIPGPIPVLIGFFQSFYTDIGKYTLIQHIGWSLSRVFIAYLFGSLAGIILGLTMGWYKLVNSIFRPLFEIIRPIPPIAWIPIAILWFGIDELPKYFIIFIAVFTNITMNAYAGAKSIDPTLVGAAKMLGANDRQIFTSIVYPSSVPYIFAGLQIALSVSFAVLLAAEMVKSNEGIGWIIIGGMSTNNTVQIFVGIITIGLLGFLLSTIMRGVEQKLLRWNRTES